MIVSEVLTGSLSSDKSMKILVGGHGLYGTVHFTDVRGEGHTIRSESQKNVNKGSVNSWTDKKGVIE